MAAKDAIAEFELENQEIRGKNRTTFWLCFPPKPFSAALCFFPSNHDCSSTKLESREKQTKERTSSYITVAFLLFV